MKRLLAILMALLLYTGWLSSCKVTDGLGKKPTPTTRATTTTNDEESQSPSDSGLSLEGYTIVYDGMDDMQKRMALKLHDALVTKRLETELLESSAAKDGDDNPYIRLENDSALENGNWRIEVRDRTVSLLAGDYNGFTGAINSFKSMVKSGTCTLKSGDVKAGSCADETALYEETARYAYDRGGDHRIMFYNVLWSDPLPAERNALKATMIAEYLPDVLGLQEFNWTVRGGAGEEGDLTVMLAELGYEETVDYRVENVTQEICDDWGKSYQSTGTLVTVDGKTFRTFYNNTPLFYNKNTTECIDRGYYMYQSQYDEENGKDSANPMGGPSSCASKSLTWGVFRSLATNETYAVISTHMCTRSNGVRALQAEEAISIVNKLAEEYDCPVFLGGDLNGNLGDANYDRFVEVGYTSLQDSKIATDFTSTVRSYLGTPVTENGLVVQGSTDPSSVIQKENKNSIDQIFATDCADVTVGVFGVVVDACTRAASDHFPIFADFSID